ENPNTKLENFRVSLRCAVFKDAGWATGKDNTIGLCTRDGVGWSIEANDFRIHLQLANAPSDDLGVLRTEIENKDFGVLRRGLSLHALRMSLGNSVFGGRIVAWPIERADRSLAGYAALQLA